MKLIILMFTLMVSHSFAASWTKVSSLMDDALNKKLFSAGTLYVGDESKALFEYSVGSGDPDKIFDIASLSKVVATTTAVMMLEEKGAIHLTDKVSKYFPAFTGGAKTNVTIEDLLRHRAGLPSGAGVLSGEKLPAYIQRITRAPLAYKPRTQTVYSDLSFILLGRVVELVSYKTLENFVETEIFEPLKMYSSAYVVAPENLSRCIPTSALKDCKVHDPTARNLLPAHVGNAGVFTSVDDLSRLVRLFLRKGEFDGVRLLSSATITKMTTPVGPRGLGWDFTSEYSPKPRGDVFPRGISFGHTGYTGTTIWIDPQSKSFYIFLSNRVYMGDERTSKPFGEFRRSLSTAVGSMTVLKR